MASFLANGPSGMPRLFIQLDDGSLRDISNCIGDIRVNVGTEGTFSSRYEYEFNVRLTEHFFNAPSRRCL